MSVQIRIGENIYLRKLLGKQSNEFLNALVKWLWSLLSGSPLMGVLAVVLTVIGFPVVAAFLFGKALVDRRMKSYMEERGMIDEYVDYEIVEEEDPDPLTLPTLEERERRSRS